MRQRCPESRPTPVGVRARPARGPASTLPPVGRTAPCGKLVNRRVRTQRVTIRGATVGGSKRVCRSKRDCGGPWRSDLRVDVAFVPFAGVVEHGEVGVRYELTLLFDVGARTPRLEQSEGRIRAKWSLENDCRVSISAQPRTGGAVLQAFGGR